MERCESVGATPLASYEGPTPTTAPGHNDAPSPLRRASLAHASGAGAAPAAFHDAIPSLKVRVKSPHVQAQPPVGDEDVRRRPKRTAALNARALVDDMELSSSSDFEDEQMSPHCPAHSGRQDPKPSSQWVGKDLLKFPGYVSRQPASVSPKTLSLEWLAQGHFDRAFLVADGGQDRNRYGNISVHTIRDSVGPDRLVRTIDVNTQNDGPTMTLHEWHQYWTYRTEGAKFAPDMYFCGGNSKHAKRVLNVVSLSLADTPLEKALDVPSIVQQSDLVRNAWPAECLPRPKAELYALMSPASCYTDWHVDFGGSSVWYHIISGKKFFAMAPPTERNLKAFSAWASSSKQNKIALVQYLENPVLYELNQGQTMLIPGGWPHAVYTPCDSLVVGGNFLHPFNMRMQLEVWRLENALGVPAKCRFPYFRTLMWHVVNLLYKRIKSKRKVYIKNAAAKPEEGELVSENVAKPLKIKITGMHRENKAFLAGLKLKVSPSGVTPSGATQTIGGEQKTEARVLTPPSDGYGGGTLSVPELMLTQKKSNNGFAHLVRVLRDSIDDKEGRADIPTVVEEPAFFLSAFEEMLKAEDKFDEEEAFPVYHKCTLPAAVYRSPEVKPPAADVAARIAHHQTKPKPAERKERIANVNSDALKLGHSKLTARLDGCKKTIKKPLGVRDRLKLRMKLKR